MVVFASGDKAADATRAGADFVGSDDLAEKIMEGWVDFDAVVATPDMMRVLGKLGKVLGPRGLMPSPKAGTVTQDVGRAVKEIKAGKIEVKADKFGNVNTVFGKLSFGEKELQENYEALLASILKLRPSSHKGTYVKGIHVSSTMGVGVSIENQYASIAT